MFLNVSLCRLVNSHSVWDCIECLFLEIKALWSFEMSITIYQLIWHNIPEDLNLPQHHCENLRSHEDGYYGLSEKQMFPLYIKYSFILWMNEWRSDYKMCCVGKDLHSHITCVELVQNSCACYRGMRFVLYFTNM